MTIWTALMVELDCQIMEAEWLSLAQVAAVTALAWAGDATLGARQRLSEQLDALEALRRQRALLERLLLAAPQHPPTGGYWQ